MVRLMTNGHRIVVGFLVLMYLAPAAGHLLFGDQVITIYKVFPVTAVAMGEIVGVYLLFVLLRMVNIPIFPPLATQTFRPFLVMLGQWYLRLRIGFGVLGLAVGALLVMTGLNTYRYGEEGISEREGWAIAVVGLSAAWTTAAHCDVFYRMFVVPQWGGKSLRRRYWENVIVSLGVILTATGIASMWVALLAMWHALAPGLARRVLLVERSEGRTKGLTMPLGRVSIFVAIFLLAWYCGALIKMSSGRAELDELLNKDPAELVGLGVFALEQYENLGAQGLSYLLGRASIYYYSWTFTAATAWEELNRDGWVLGTPVKTFLFRLDVVLGGLIGIERPNTTSIMRLNYELLAEEPLSLSHRAGTAPGLLGAFNYAFPFPLNIVLCALFLRWWCRQFDTLFVQHRKPMTWFGVLVAFVMLQGLFQSPFDWLLILDSGVIMPLLLGAVAVVHRRAPLVGVRTMQ